MRILYQDEDGEPLSCSVTFSPQNVVSLNQNGNSPEFNTLVIRPGQPGSLYYVRIDGAGINQVFPIAKQ